MANLNWWGFDLNAFLLVFIVLNVVNVIIQTVKSIATVSWGKWGASIANAIAYSLYTVVVIFMSADGLGIMWKALIIGLANLGGVYVVKLIEEKRRKEKLWKIEMAIPKGTNLAVLKNRIEWCGVSCNHIEVGSWVVFNCYCERQTQTKAMIEIAKEFGGKISAYESKNLYM